MHTTNSRFLFCGAITFVSVCLHCVPNKLNLEFLRGVKNKLKEMGKICEEDIALVMEQFQQLDVVGYAIAIRSDNCPIRMIGDKESTLGIHPYDVEFLQ